jgi:hypothetical protein
LDEHVQQAGLTLSTSYKSVAIAKRNSSESIEKPLEQMAAGIQELINVEISSRRIVNA